MNTTSRTLFATVLIAIAGAASLVLVDAPEAAAPGQQVVRLETVVIVGRRTPDVTVASAQKIERLPTVVIEGRRTLERTEVARAACAAPAVC